MTLMDDLDRGDGDEVAEMWELRSARLAYHSGAIDEMLD
jgi:hypothetical protein